MAKQVRISDPELFSEGKLESWLSNLMSRALASATAATERELGQSDAELSDEIRSNYAVKPVRFRFEDLYAQDPVEGNDHELRVTVSFPFDGDGELLRRDANYRAVHTGNPRGTVVDSEHDNKRLVFTVCGVGLDSESVESEVRSMRHRLSRAVDSSNRWVERWNAELAEQVQAAVAGRFERIAGLQELRSAITIPIRRTPDLAIDVPATPRTAPIVKVARDASSHEVRAAPDWVIEDSIYHEILLVLERFAAAAGRLPRSTMKLTEPDFRNFALLVLNSHFTALNAVGEAFNGEGKTDILVPWRGRNVFVAEFKEYDGPKSVLAALNQLLGYITWQDSKAALVLLVERANATAALSLIHEFVEKHPNHRSTVSPSESDRRLSVAMKKSPLVAKFGSPLVAR